MGGMADMVDFSPIAFFCSQSCPGDVILKAQDWANARSPESSLVIGGFHTPVERDVLRILLRGAAPVAIVLARAFRGWRTPAPLGLAIRDAVAAGRARILEPFPAERRTSSASAESRNRHDLTLADTILNAHASPGGKTEALARDALSSGLTLQTFPSTHNANLLEIGAQVFSGNIGSCH